MPARYKKIPMNAVLLVLLLAWFSLELFWLPTVHNRLTNTIKDRIIMSDVISSMNLNEKKFPHVVTYIQNNFEIKNISPAEIQSEFTALISTAVRENGVTLKSLKYIGSQIQNRENDIESELEISGSLTAIQNFFSDLEIDTRIIIIESIEVKAETKVKAFRFVNSIPYNVKIHLRLSKIKLS